VKRPVCVCVCVCALCSTEMIEYSSAAGTAAAAAAAAAMSLPRAMHPVSVCRLVIFYWNETGQLAAAGPALKRYWR